MENEYYSTHPCPISPAYDIYFSSLWVKLKQASCNVIQASCNTVLPNTQFSPSITAILMSCSPYKMYQNLQASLLNAYSQAPLCDMASTENLESGTWTYAF